MNRRNLLLVAALGAALAGPANAQPGEIEWFGNVYAKFLDGDRRLQGALYNVAETTPAEAGGDSGQGVEFELMFRNQVSSQVEIGGRLKARFNRNFWTNFGGFGREEQDPRSAQYVKMRGVYAILTPGYAWIDSATIGSNDFGMFDPLTQGKYRYIDRDNASGFLFQGSVPEASLRWDVARVSLPRLFAGPRFVTTRDPNNPATAYEVQDAAWTGQLRWSPNPDFNSTAILTYVRDKEIDLGDTDVRDGQKIVTRYDNTVAALKGDFSGFQAFDIGASYYWSNYNVDDTECDGNINGNCRYSPLLGEGAKDNAWFLNLDVADVLIPDLTFNLQAFHIGADFMSVQSARRESDVLLMEGWMGTWGWGLPDYNFGNRFNSNSRLGAGYGGWNGETHQVVSLMADNDFTDFDEPYAYSVIGYKGFTLVPQYRLGDWEFKGEISYVDYDTNWQACGHPELGFRAGCGSKYPRNEGTNSWGLGGDFRSAYSPYQERETWFYGLRVNYFLDLGKGVDIEGVWRFIDDEDLRVTNAAYLADAYDGFQDAVAAETINPDWVPNIGLGGCVGCDDRKAEYSLLGISLGYQLHPDLYGKLILEQYKVSLVDGTIDVAPSALTWDASNAFGHIEYLTGEHTKNRVGLAFNYFLSGVEFGAAVDWFWGDYQPEFYVDQDGQRVRLIPTGETVATPVGNISTSKVDLEQYRLKAFMKVSF
jgi:hypothetical protein